MKIKLNKKQVLAIKRELEETDRKKFDVSEVMEVFRMLKYWSKCVGGDETAIKTVVELPDGYLCRVNREFRESIKTYLKDIRSRRAETAEERKQQKKQEFSNKFDRLVREAEERKNRAKTS